ncbi:MAG TPA: cbb3-type cytochrome c oxidase subunit II [Opitutaceae bacterium]|nr:cbb3-type cytochrome c oxidase subunit II [Opitutaceae bacterium]
MKNNFLYFLGVFAALGISWAGIVLGSNAQLGNLAPYYDDNEQATFPSWMAGQAARGQLVYKDLGCVACHTQQVRRPGFGSDQERGWGDRQSVARDYIYQPFPQLGSARIGPDLANLGDRKPSAPDADDILHLLYTGGKGMPSYRFLFEKRKVGVGAQPALDALSLTGSQKPAEGWEVVPTNRATALAAYLVSLKNPYTFPEAAPVAAAKDDEVKNMNPAAPNPPPKAGIDANAEPDKTSPAMVAGGTPMASPPTPAPAGQAAASPGAPAPQQGTK